MSEGYRNRCCGILRIIIWDDFSEKSDMCPKN